MRATTWSLFLAGVVLGASLSTVGCAGKSKAQAAPPAPPKPAALAPPPETLTMKVDVTPPKPPPPPPAPAKPDPCVVLQGALASSIVHFDLDRSTLDTSAVAQVTAADAAIKLSGMGPGLSFSIEGHCDQTGSDGYNLALSDRRAKAVSDRLIALGSVNATRAKTVPWGEQKPVDPGTTPEAYAKNRRVEIVVSCPTQ
jgi:peptidoglycan-associated lipoprotein